MNPARPIRRYRSNPVEVVILTVVAFVSVNSVYHLFYDHPSYTPIALTPMNSNPTSEGRQLASISRPLLNMEIQCNETSNQETSANKLRLKGPICGVTPEISGSSLVKTSIINTSNQFNATIFTDIASGQFSTDYIPLKSGENLIRFEFSYESGKTISQDIHVTRN